jgi:hypothetical protein
MAEPSIKMQSLRNTLDHTTRLTYGREASTSIENDICVSCGAPAVEFSDEISKREFSISGLCQKCQDVVFAPDEEDE